MRTDLSRIVSNRPHVYVSFVRNKACSAERQATQHKFHSHTRSNGDRDGTQAEHMASTRHGG